MNTNPAVRVPFRVVSASTSRRRSQNDPPLCYSEAAGGGDDVNVKPKRKCTIPGCQNWNLARGYCSTHYTRWFKYGYPEAVSRFDPDFRFWPNVNKNAPNGCWEWTGALTPKGYGAFRFQGRQDGAHRVVWVLLVGPIPDNLFVLHRCDNRRCVNPAHLFLGTQRDNVHDAIQKGRFDPWTAGKAGREAQRLQRESVAMRLDAPEVEE